MLDHLDEGLWAVTSPLKVLGLIPMASRMTVVRLNDGGLFVHSPVRLEPKLKAALDALGPTRHVIAPNRMHHLFCGDYRSAYPEARLYGAPGLAEKRPELAPLTQLGDAAPETWAGEIDQPRSRCCPAEPGLVAGVGVRPGRGRPWRGNRARRQAPRAPSLRLAVSGPTASPSRALRRNP
jgi:hypothetical protein